MTNFSQIFENHKIPWKIKDLKSIQNKWLSLLALEAISNKNKIDIYSYKWIYKLRKFQLLNQFNVDEESHRQKKLNHCYNQLHKLSSKDNLNKEIIFKHINLINYHENIVSVNYRKSSVWVKCLKESYKESFPPYYAVNELMSALFSWRNSMGDEDLWMKIFGTHLILLSIHPFSNGNGRLARQIEYQDMFYKLPSIRNIVNPEIIAHWRFQKYSKALRESRSIGYLDPFILHQLNNYFYFIKAKCCNA